MQVVKEEDGEEMEEKQGALSVTLAQTTIGILWLPVKKNLITLMRCVICNRTRMFKDDCGWIWEGGVLSERRYVDLMLGLDSAFI